MPPAVAGEPADAGFRLAVPGRVRLPLHGHADGSGLCLLALPVQPAAESGAAAVSDHAATEQIARVKEGIRLARARGDAGAVARLLGELRQLRAEQAAEALTGGAGTRVWLDPHHGEDER